MSSRNESERNKPIRVLSQFVLGELKYEKRFKQLKFSS